MHAAFFRDVIYKIIFLEWNVRNVCVKSEKGKLGDMKIIGTAHTFAG